MRKNTFQNYMSDSEIVNFIKKYVNKSSYNYAILLDGSWGCGKTFFIKETLIPALKDNEENKTDHDDCIGRKVIYVSLYGITKKEEITKKIWIESV